MIRKNWTKHNQLFEKHNGRFEKDNEQFEKRNCLLGHEKPSLGCETVSRGPFATVQMGISNRPNEKMNRAKRKKAGVGTPAFAPKII
ncbi:MAG TPA: hypothetical protein DHW31_04420 [Bacteroides graminisolvens]|uniref:Uncharacterized protein n=1 Tax=Bacteroides graminisolvens TaxID=477666 RepID=A0A3D2SET4_9BACE|nr:hypothetical protein [Bacteroides graminisolvens]